MTEGPAWLNAIGQIFHVIPDLATPEQVQSTLREILEDPGLELFWWSRDELCYVDVHEVRRDQLATAPTQVVTLVEYDTRKVGAIAHSARLLERPEFLESFVPTMRIAMEHEEARGCQVFDVSAQNLGYDVTSVNLTSGELRLIEVKGVGAPTGTILLTPNERRMPGTSNMKKIWGFRRFGSAKTSRPPGFSTRFTSRSAGRTSRWCSTELP